MVIKLSQCLAVHDKQTSNTLTFNENIVLTAANYTLTGIWNVYTEIVLNT